MKYILPLFITIIILSSQLKRKNTYNSFISGAEDGLEILKSIFPALLGVMTASSMLRASGALDMLIGVLYPITNALGIPKEIMPIALLRPISGGGSLGLLSDILNTYGADSFIGKAASVIMGSTETTFYCISVYYAKTRAKSTAKILFIALLCDMSAAVIAVQMVQFFCK